MDKKYAQEVLQKFLTFPIGTARPVLTEFARLPGAISAYGEGKEGFVFVPGKRKDRVVLAAHADTVWDDEYIGAGEIVQSVRQKRGVYTGEDNRYGIGADDRAGCAMLWCLKDSGHSLLVLDGEEHGQIGAHFLLRKYPDLAKEINDHGYILQLDRRGKRDYKTYNLPVTEEFKRFIEEKTGYEDAGRLSRTDIVVLCQTVCGANLSVGYYDEHTSFESLDFNDWFRTLQTVEKLLFVEQKRYPM